MSATAPAPPRAAPTFAPGVVLALLLVGLFAFVGLGVLLAYGPELQGGQGGGTNALSRSAVGYAGVVRLLRQTGRVVEIGRGRTRFRPAKGLLVLTPPPGARAVDLARLTAGETRPVLLVLPKWAALPDPRHLGWVIGAGTTPPASVLKLFPAAGARPDLQRRSGVTDVALQSHGVFSDLAELDVAPVDTLQTAELPGAEVLISDQYGRPVLSHVEGQPYVLSDPDLLDNLGLADARTAATAASLIQVLGGGDGPVVFDVSLDGLGRPRSLLGLALAPPFLGASLCVLAAALMMGAHAAVRFGPARGEGRALALGKTALLDNAAMLIALAKREPAMGRRYAAVVRRALARRAGVMRGEASDAALDRLAPRADPPFATLAGEAERARDVPALMRAARALHRRQVEIMGEPS